MAETIVFSEGFEILGVSSWDVEVYNPVDDNHRRLKGYNKAIFNSSGTAGQGFMDLGKYSMASNNQVPGFLGGTSRSIGMRDTVNTFDKNSIGFAFKANSMGADTSGFGFGFMRTSNGDTIRAYIKYVSGTYYPALNINGAETVGTTDVGTGAPWVYMVLRCNRGAGANGTAYIHLNGNPVAEVQAAMPAGFTYDKVIHDVFLEKSGSGGASLRIFLDDVVNYVDSNNVSAMKVNQYFPAGSSSTLFTGSGRSRAANVVQNENLNEFRETDGSSANAANQDVHTYTGILSGVTLDSIVGVEMVTVGSRASYVGANTNSFLISGSIETTKDISDDMTTFTPNKSSLVSMTDPNTGAAWTTPGVQAITTGYRPRS